MLLEGNVSIKPAYFTGFINAVENKKLIFKNLFTYSVSISSDSDFNAQINCFTLYKDI